MRLIIGLTLLCLAGCGAGDPVSSSTPIRPASAEPAPVTVPEAPIQVVPDNSAPVAVFIGDSITERWYPQLPNLYPYMVDVGVTGETSVQMLARFDSDVLHYHPYNVVITAGTNDLLLLQNPSIDSIAQMAQVAASHNIGVIIGLPPPAEYWKGPMFVNDSAKGRAAFTTFRQQLRSLAQAHGYHVADFYSPLTLPDGTQDASLFQDDRVHPNAAGYLVMWHVVEKLFRVTPGLPVCSIDAAICY